MNDMELVKWARVCSTVADGCEGCPFEETDSSSDFCVSLLVSALAERVEKLADRCARYAEEIAVARENPRGEVVIEDFDGLSIHRLRELAEADRGGRVVVLPCKVGDTVFLLDRNRGHCYECEVEYVNIGRLCRTVVVRSRGDGQQAGATFSAFGKTVFLTREEAEAALKEGRS